MECGRLGKCTELLTPGIDYDDHDDDDDGDPDHDCEHGDKDNDNDYGGDVTASARSCSLQVVPRGYPNPTRYPVFLLIPDPTRFSFRNHRVAGNPKHRVLPNILGKPRLSGTTRYSGYHP